MSKRFVVTIVDETLWNEIQKTRHKHGKNASIMDVMRDYIRLGLVVDQDYGPEVVIDNRPFVWHHNEGNNAEVPPEVTT